jgi:CMP-N-acetylneuraminic acid synthetase
MVKVLGVITARGGSKGIPAKNLKLLGGKPLLSYTIEAAHGSGAFDRLIVTTDDALIAEIARNSGCEVPFMRPADLARDDTPHLPVMQHAVAWLDEHDRYRPDCTMILQPTSPLRQPHHVREAIDLMVASGADSVVSVSDVPVHYHPMRTLRVDASGCATLLVTGDPIGRRINRRQDLPPAWAMNGAIYLFRTSLLFDREPDLYGAHSLVYVMAPPYDISIDSPADWVEAERALDQLGITHD